MLLSLLSPPVTTFLYAVIYSSTLGDPSAAQVKSGKDSTDTNAIWSGFVSAPLNTQTFDWPTIATGLTPNTSYKIAFVWSNGTLNSNVAVSDIFTTASGAVGYIKVWNGTDWVLKPIKIWNGTSWIAKTAKFWNGSSWVII